MSAASNEKYETVYMTEEEIQKFLANYKHDHPEVEFETRHMKQTPIKLEQEINVKYLAL